jgi:hypothetical protein
MIHDVPLWMWRALSFSSATSMSGMWIAFLMRSCCSWLPASAPSAAMCSLEAAIRSSEASLKRAMVSISYVPFHQKGEPASISDWQNSLERFSATPKFASWKRTVLNLKRACSSSSSSASCLPGIAFQRRPVTIGEQQNVHGSGQPKLEKWLKPRYCMPRGMSHGSGYLWRTLTRP